MAPIRTPALVASVGRGSGSLVQEQCNACTMLFSPCMGAAPSSHAQTEHPQSMAGVALGKPAEGLCRHTEPQRTAPSSATLQQGMQGWVSPVESTCMVVESCEKMAWGSEQSSVQALG